MLALDFGFCCWIRTRTLDLIDSFFFPLFFDGLLLFFCSYNMITYTT
jgi:hypothetical protein